MELVSQFDFKLHQMGVKMKFLNGDLEEKVYMNNLRDSYIVLVNT